jgi:hypothetical protein
MFDQDEARNKLSRLIRDFGMSDFETPDAVTKTVMLFKLTVNEPLCNRQTAILYGQLSLNNKRNMEFC